MRRAGRRKASDRWRAPAKPSHLLVTVSPNGVAAPNLGAKLGADALACQTLHDRHLEIHEKRIEWRRALGNSVETFLTIATRSRTLRT